MEKPFRVGIFLFFLLVSSGSYARPTSQHALTQDLLNQQIQLHLRNKTLGYALNVLAVEHRVPIGIERSLADKNEPKINLEIDRETLKEVLDAIVNEEPLYRWEIVDDVINFVPRQERDPFFEALLNTPVDHFNPGKWTIIFQVRNAIGEIPEVKRLMESNQKTLFKYGDYVKYPSIYTKKDVDLSISNTTVRGVLNRIIRDSEHKGWSISWLPGDKDALTISF